MKTGDLVKSKGLAHPVVDLGEVGVLLDYDGLRGGWWVQFADGEVVVATSGLEVINESR